ncbi:hypothetical protein F5J12DRAFT_897793 [Pisolithus orientalis]|uniref:uncharacterized protein n=1 Tax=Pisolithus orientalis TaxID=936130 RepID=UPI002224FAE5|nr:uncharacterized protein F5J12DRAFT_897793 [Pisolithus orientalis]KAI5990038.1 hypothetical protein F5J12DRAFT_897793 [Pisolithus orientalis]
MTSVLAFFFSMHEISGQHLIAFKHLKDNIEFYVKTNVFPADAALSKTDIFLETIHFCVIFDHHHHQHLRSQASYLFIHLNQQGHPIHIWPEHDLNHILDTLLMYFPTPAHILQSSNPSPS